MRFPPQFLDELRARLPVSEVVGRRVKLKKSGREWKGLSPFNQEKTPSFFVNDQKGFFHDFSSGKHGDIFGFVMETEGVTFPEAVERLAAMAGLPVPKLSKEAEEREDRRKTLHDIMELAAKFYEATLASRAGAAARGYLADRGIAPATQLKFRLGYAPADRFALKEHLGSHGIPVADMVEVGLLIAGDDIAVPFDRFRNRVMFPICDFRDRVIAFGGRALDKEAPAKYLNSPETPLFHKGATLFNGATARAAAHHGATVIAVEGYVDVIAMVTAGFPATVAPLGTALTEDQLALLWKMADEPVLCFDGDKAGRSAAYRAIDLALPQLRLGKSLRFASLPQGQDPDDLVRSGGSEAVAEVIAGARPLSDMLWLRETEAGTYDTPERRAALAARVAQVASTVGDEAVRKYYREELANRLRGLFAAREPVDERPRRMGGEPRQRSGQFAGRGRTRGGSANPRDFLAPVSPRLATSPLVRGIRSALPAREALILLAVINHPWLLEAHAEEFAELEFRAADADRLRGAILDAGAGHQLTDGAELRAALEARGMAPVLARIAAAITHASDWPARATAAPQDVGCWWAHVVTLHRKSRTLNRELQEAEQALGREPSDANLAWLCDVQQRLAALEGSEALIEGFGASSGRPVRTF
jgi:DNA primase